MSWPLFCYKNLKMSILSVEYKILEVYFYGIVFLFNIIGVCQGSYVIIKVKKYDVLTEVEINVNSPVKRITRII